MLKDAKGNRLFRKVIVRVVFPDDIFPPKDFIQHAGPHQGVGDTGIDEMLMSVADQLETLYPWWEFELVTLKPEGRTMKYVMRFAGYRTDKKPPALEITEFKADAVDASQIENCRENG